MLGVQAFTYLPLQHWYRPEVPFLRPLFAAVFIFGLINLAFRPKDGRTITFFLWLAMYVLIGGLSESTPAAQRYVAAALRHVSLHMDWVRQSTCRLGQNPRAG
jgi:hypothetical protein